MRCVTDANVWIDLDYGGLLGRAFELGDDLVIPDVIFYEEVFTPDTGLLLRLGIQVSGLTGAQLTALIDTLAGRYPRASLRDLSSLILARDEGSVLVTGDKALRKAAEKEGVEVHGVLWVLDRLVSEAGLLPVEAARSLRLMLRGGARLPKVEVEKRLREWEGDGGGVPQ